MRTRLKSNDVLLNSSCTRIRTVRFRIHAPRFIRNNKRENRSPMLRRCRRRCREGRRA